MSAITLQNSQHSSLLPVNLNDLQLLELLQKTLKIQLATLGLGPEVVASYNNIGLIHCRRQEWDSAFEAFKNTLKIRIATLGEAHPDVAKSYINLGNVYYSRKTYNQALELFQKALNIQSSASQINYSDMAKNYSNIGAVYHKEEKYDQAFQYYQNGVMLLSDKFQNHRSEVGDILRNTLVCMEKMSSFNREQADKMYELCVHTFGIEHPLSQKFTSIFKKYYYGL